MCFFCHLGNRLNVAGDLVARRTLLFHGARDISDGNADMVDKFPGWSR